MPMPTEPPGAPGIAVIIGWMGSAEKHMNKYAQLWQSIGWEPMVVRYNKWRVLLSTVGDRLTAQDHKALEDLHAAHLAAGGQGRVVFHCFSNTGWLSMGTFMEHFAHEGHPMHRYLCGAVIDSAPQPKVCHRTYAAGYITAVTPKKPLREDSAAMKVVTTMFKVWVQGPRKRTLKQVARHIHERSRFPQLYIYSANDPIILASSVEGAIEAQLKEGRNVRTLRIEDSPHCQHYRFHRDAYMKALLGFVEEVLQEDMSGIAREGPGVLTAQRSDSAMMEHPVPKGKAAQSRLEKVTSGVPALDLSATCAHQLLSCDSTESELSWETERHMRDLMATDMSAGTSCDLGTVVG